jgi:hypothetical protein
MSLGGDSFDHQEHYIDRLYAEAERDRLAKAAKAVPGYRSPWRRLRDRVRPHRQQLGGDAESVRRVNDDPGRGGAGR